MPIKGTWFQPRDRIRTISPPPPAIEISTPQEIIVTIPHPPLFPHHGFCLGVDFKPSFLLSWGTPASPPWGSCSCSLLTPAHEVWFSPLPSTCFAPCLAFCTVGKLVASFTVSSMVSGLSVKVRLRFCWACRVPNGRRKTRLDQLVQSKVKSSLMVEIRLTGQSRLLKPTRPGLVRPGPPSNGICYFYHYILLSNKAFLNKNYCFHGLYGGDSASL